MPLDLLFIVLSKVPYLLHMEGSAALLLHFQTDLQLIYFAKNIPVLFIITVPGNYTNVADPKPLFCN